jgi:hypothetical protein
MADHLLGGISKNFLGTTIPARDDAVQVFSDNGVVRGAQIAANRAESSLRSAMPAFKKNNARDKVVRLRNTTTGRNRKVTVETDADRFSASPAGNLLRRATRRAHARCWPRVPCRCRGPACAGRRKNPAAVERRWFVPQRRCAGRSAAQVDRDAVFDEDYRRSVCEDWQCLGEFPPSTVPGAPTDFRHPG